MSKAKFSKFNGGIYPTDVYKTFPEDAIDIPNDLYNQFKSGAFAGFDVVSGVVVAKNFQPSLPSKFELLDTITVTTQSGKTFHGDEVSQGRIARALQIAGFTGQTQTGWKLTDGNTHIVTVEELQEALRLAMIEVGRIVGAIE